MIILNKITCIYRGIIIMHQLHLYAELRVEYHLSLALEYVE